MHVCMFKKNRKKMMMMCSLTCQFFGNRSADVNDVAGLLKMYIRELPEPLLTFDAYRYTPPSPFSCMHACIVSDALRVFLSEFVCAAREGNDGLGERVKGLVGSLREEHQAALWCLVELLHKVSKGLAG